MATIIKLPSGKYRIRKIFNGVRYETIVASKPTKKDADRLIYKVMEDAGGVKRSSGSFSDAAERYIDSKSAILSPATIVGYRSMLRNVPDSFKDISLARVTEETVQNMLNVYAADHSGKSVRNMSGFVSSVLHANHIGKNFELTIPRKEKPAFDLPEDDDVKKVLDALKGDKYEIPIRLACYGLRRSEICALVRSDLDGQTLSINKALVPNDKKQYVVKATKTEESKREIVIDSNLSRLIEQTTGARVYNGSPAMINKHLKKIEDKLEIKRFSLHKLRHYYAATALEVMPELYVAKSGGWKANSPIMKEVYAYTKEKKEKESAEAYIKKVESLLS